MIELQQSQTLHHRIVPLQWKKKMDFMKKYIAEIYISPEQIQKIIDNLRLM